MIVFWLIGSSQQLALEQLAQSGVPVSDAPTDLL
jgi:hypothetical protein